MEEAIAAIVAVLAGVENHYSRCDNYYEHASRLGDAEALLYVLRDGVQARDDLHNRLRTGQIRPGELAQRTSISVHRARHFLGCGPRVFHESMSERLGVREAESIQVARRARGTRVAIIATRVALRGDPFPEAVGQTSHLHHRRRGSYRAGNRANRPPGYRLRSPAIGEAPEQAATFRFAEHQQISLFARAPKAAHQASRIRPVVRHKCSHLSALSRERSASPTNHSGERSAPLCEPFRAREMGERLWRNRGVGTGRTGARACSPPGRATPRPSLAESTRSYSGPPWFLTVAEVADLAQRTVRQVHHDIEISATRTDAGGPPDTQGKRCRHRLEITQATGF